MGRAVQSLAATPRRQSRDREGAVGEPGIEARDAMLVARHGVTPLAAGRPMFDIDGCPWFSGATVTGRGAP